MSRPPVVAPSSKGGARTTQEEFDAPLDSRSTRRGRDRRRRIGAPHGKWYHAPSYKWCGYGEHAKEFAFRRHDVSAVKVRVSQIGKHGHHVFGKGEWHSVPEA
ncbi:hypothetical protein [Planobispora takensis]|uniref:Uncharacterized protein n=1 Tax=Planobispora takensis TaxID=1367882 RepID=A0A8J3SUZ6_9ACTN|nr:hypothetical protein [Planobispora takensis]GIH99839.1 hypothetical protein Pta02_18480 [Planobispora takensis]